MPEEKVVTSKSFFTIAVFTSSSANKLEAAQFIEEQNMENSGFVLLDALSQVLLTREVSWSSIITALSEFLKMVQNGFNLGILYTGVQTQQEVALEISYLSTIFGKDLNKNFLIVYPPKNQSYKQELLNALDQRNLSEFAGCVVSRIPSAMDAKWDKKLIHGINLTVKVNDIISVRWFITQYQIIQFLQVLQHQLSTLWGRIPEKAFIEIIQIFFEEPQQEDVSNGLDAIPSKLMKKINEIKVDPKRFTQFIEAMLNEELSQIDESQMKNFEHMPLCKLLTSIYHMRLLYHPYSEVCMCQFPRNVTIVFKDLVDYLQGIQELEAIRSRIRAYSPSTARDTEKDLRKFLTNYPYLKDYETSKETTLLYECVDYGFLKGVRILVHEFNCTIDLPSTWAKSSPLLLAARKKLKDIANYLISMGADSSKQNNAGETPYQFMPDFFKQQNTSDLKSKYRWQYSFEGLTFINFKHSECEKIQNLVFNGNTKPIWLNDSIEYEFNLDIQNFSGIKKENGNATEIILRYIG